jgi:hypothetical protein
VQAIHPYKRQSSERRTHANTRCELKSSEAYDRHVSPHLIVMEISVFILEFTHCNVSQLNSEIFTRLRLVVTTQLKKGKVDGKDSA